MEEIAPEEIARRRQIVKRWRGLLNERGKRYENCRLSNYCVAADPAVASKQQFAIDQLRDYAKHIGERIAAGTSIILFGPSGTGKDHLLMAMANAAVYRADKGVVWRNGMDLFGEIRDRMTDTDESERSLVRRLVLPDVFYLSDPLPPTGELRDFQQQMLFRILDGRYNQLRPTWVSVNVSSRIELDERMGVTLAERLVDGALTIYCNWPSYRKKAERKSEVGSTRVANGGQA